MEYGYRDSRLKRATIADGPVVLSATFSLGIGDPTELARQADKFVAHRRATQPPGASVGSMFKNPPGDYAGRLIESAGLKGTKVGSAQISPLHANFFVNLGRATASDVKSLVDIARRRVLQESGIELELEIELVGDWENRCH
jgi:UDP-N-acetylmuramate dehydrogenase